jgi:DNA-binding transcriptional LysR family regulator
MELLQLEYFQVVAKYENITKAAKELHIAQPSLSNTISRLEADLGVPLFDRKGKNIKLNLFGQTFLQYVDLVLSKLEEARKELQDLNGTEFGSIRIAATNPRVLPVLLGDFLSKYPNVHIQQRQVSSIEMQRLLEKGEIDFCLSSVKIESKDIEWRLLLDEKIFLSVPYNHRLAHRKKVLLEEIKDERFIALPAGYGFRDLTDELCQKRGYKPFVAFEGEEAAMVQNFVERGFGVSFTPVLSLLSGPHPESISVEIADEDASRPIGLAKRKDYYLSTSAKLLYESMVVFFSEWKKVLEKEDLVEFLNKNNKRSYTSL